MQIWCVLCSMGWAVGLTSLFILGELTKAPRWLEAALAFLVIGGFGSCAAEERVCEIAGLEADP